MDAVSRFSASGSILAGNARGRCTGFDLQLAIESDEGPEKIAALVRTAHQMCYVEDALVNPMPVRQTHLLNGEPLEVGDGAGGETQG